MRCTAIGTACLLGLVVGFCTYARGDLVAHYRFDDGSGQTAADSTGNYDGTLGSTTSSDGNDPTWTSGIIGGALEFLVDDHVDTKAFLLPATGNFTAMGWAKTGSSDNYRALLGQGTSYDNTQRLIYYTSFTSTGISNKSRLFIGGEVVKSTTVTNTDKWFHLATTREGNIFKIYVNGILEATRTTPRTVETDDDPSHYNKTIIGNADGGGGSFCMEGLIDDVGIFVGIFDSTENAQRIATIHGLGRLRGVDLGDDGVDDVLGVFRGATGSAAAGGFVWTYATGLTGDMGAVGSESGRGLFIVLDASGNGVVGVPEPGAVMLLIFGAGLLASAIRRRRT